MYKQEDVQLLYHEIKATLCLFLAPSWVLYMPILSCTELVDHWLQWIQGLWSDSPWRKIEFVPDYQDQWGTLHHQCSPHFFPGVLDLCSSTKITFAGCANSNYVFLPDASSSLSTGAPSWLNHCGSSSHFPATPQLTMLSCTFSYICSKLWTVHQSLQFLSNWTTLFAES